MTKQQQAQTFTVDADYLKEQARDAMRTYFAPLKGILHAVKPAEMHSAPGAGKKDD